MSAQSVQTLEIRQTRTYVGSYRHLDQWKRVGACQVIQRSARVLDEEDPCEPTEILNIVCVEAEPGVRSAEVEQALRDTFSSAGCAHEWDCCGCWSSYAKQVSRLDRDRYQVVVSASRNY
jgi:hypothetical protein